MYEDLLSAAVRTLCNISLKITHDSTWAGSKVKGIKSCKVSLDEIQFVSSEELEKMICNVNFAMPNRHEAAGPIVLVVV